MRHALVGAALVVFTLTPNPNATFRAGGVTSRPSSVVATIQPRAGAPGYSWLRIYFYDSALDARDRAAAIDGRIRSVKTPWSAVLQLTVDRDSNVSQIDLALPGHSCTVAESEGEAKASLSRMHFDGTHLSLAGRGSHVCDMRSLGVPDETFAWDFDVDVPVAGLDR
jgi:hypothetical protein